MIVVENYPAFFKNVWYFSLVVKRLNGRVVFRKQFRGMQSSIIPRCCKGIGRKNDPSQDRRYLCGLSAIFEGIFFGVGKPANSLSLEKQCAPLDAADFSDTVHASVPQLRNETHGRARTHSPRWQPTPSQRYTCSGESPPTMWDHCDYVSVQSTVWTRIKVSYSIAHAALVDARSRRR